MLRFSRTTAGWQKKDIRTEKKTAQRAAVLDQYGGKRRRLREIPEAAAVFHIPQERNLFRPAALTAES